MGVGTQIGGRKQETNSERERKVTVEDGKGAGGGGMAVGQRRPKAAGHREGDSKEGK
jgi:hypothetical protein